MDCEYGTRQCRMPHRVSHAAMSYWLQNGPTLLHTGAARGLVDLVRVLLACGANKEAVTAVREGRGGQGWFGGGRGGSGGRC